jgi:hypothetical protein
VTKSSIKDDEQVNEVHRNIAARKAKAEGFIKLINLESILAADNSCPSETLKYLDSIFKPGAPEPKNFELQEYRHVFWLFLLLRWTGLRAEATKIMLPDIGKYLSSYLLSRTSGNYELIEIGSATSEYFDKAYISLAELSAYFKNIEYVYQISLPLPVSLRFLPSDIEATRRHHRITRKLTGEKVIEQMNISPADLLRLMRDGLPAYTSNGDLIFDIDAETINNQAGPSEGDLILAERRHAINEIRKARGQEAEDVTEFPPGWYGISFSPPQNLEDRQGYFEKILTLYFAIDDIEQYALLLEGGETTKEQNVNIHESSGKEVIAVPKGTNWSQITITVIDDERARIKTPVGERLFHRSELGMESKISGRPTLLWGSLCFFAKFNGRIDPKTHNVERRVIDSLKRLNKKLKEIFGMPENAWNHYRKNKEYVTKFRIDDKREKEIS